MLRRRRRHFLLHAHGIKHRPLIYNYYNRTMFVFKFFFFLLKTVKLQLNVLKAGENTENTTETLIVLGMDIGTTYYICI